MRRRTVLQGSAALAMGLMMPSFAKPPFANAPFAKAQSNPDVIVVGAGLAGISTEHSLIAKKYIVSIVEARSRIGGRAYTESASLGVPLDHGCAWLYDPVGDRIFFAGEAGLPKWGGIHNLSHVTVNDRLHASIVEH